MQWGNPLFSVLLSLHYFSSHVVCQFSFRNFNSQSQNNSTNSGANVSRFYKVDPKCSNSFNSTLHICQNQNQNSQNYQHYYNHNPNYNPIHIKKQIQWDYGQRDNRNSYSPYSNQIQNQPVYHYSNPISYDTLKSRVEEASSHGSSHHPESHMHSNNHNEHKGSHQPEKGDGWGGAKGHETHEYHHKEKKKRKKKKGPLAKLLKKFKPKHKPEKLIWKEVPECDGFENFIKDVEILSLKLGWIGFKKATVAFILHILNQIYGFFSVVIVGLPERLTTFVDLIAPATTPEQLRILLAVIGILDYIVIFTLSYPLGNLIVAIDAVAEVVTLSALALATFTIFDDIVEEKVWAIFGIDLRELFEGYGCDNPYGKEKQFFGKFKGW